MIQFVSMKNFSDCSHISITPLLCYPMSGFIALLSIPLQLSAKLLGFERPNTWFFGRVGAEFQNMGSIDHSASKILLSLTQSGLLESDVWPGVLRSSIKKATSCKNAKGTKFRSLGVF